jgi:hypothetical protein
MSRILGDILRERQLDQGFESGAFDVTLKVRIAANAVRLR